MADVGFTLHLAPAAGNPTVSIPGPQVEVGVAPNGTVHAGATLPQGTRHWLSLRLTPQGCAAAARVPTLLNGQPLSPSGYVLPGAILSAGNAQVQLVPVQGLSASGSLVNRTADGPPQVGTPPASRPRGYPGLVTPQSGPQAGSSVGLIPDSQGSQGSQGSQSSQSAAPQLPQRGMSYGPYRLDEVLGQGGHGVVYRAWDARLQRPVALKILMRRTPHARERFLREARALASLNHPGVVSVHDLGERDGFAFVVTEFIEGTGLEEHTPGSTEPGQAAAILRDVALAAHHAHTHQIIHRDIKPSNVLIDREGTAFLVDFGIASLQDTGTNPGLTTAGVPIGTPAFMAPEQVGGQADPRADVFGLGATLLWLLTGVAPGAVPEWDDLESTEELPRGLRTVLRRALAPKPEQRYATAEEFARALDAISRPQGVALKGVLAALALGGIALGVAYASGAVGGTSQTSNAVGAAKEPTPADLLRALEDRAPESDWLTLQAELEPLRAKLQDQPLLSERLERLITQLRWRDARDAALRLDAESGSLNEVLGLLEQGHALQSDEAATGPLEQLALVLRRGDYLGALERAQDLEPNATVLWTRARALAELGRLEDALAACDELADHPDPWPDVAKGERLLLLGAPELAYEAARAAVATSPATDSARLLEVRCALAAQDAARALKLAEDARAPHDPRPEVYLLQALKGDGDYARRRTHLERAEALYGTRAPLQLKLLRLELELESQRDPLPAAQALLASRDPLALVLRGAAVAPEDAVSARQLWARAYAADAFRVEASLRESAWLPVEAIRDAAGVSAPAVAEFAPTEFPRYAGVTAAADPAVRRALELSARGAAWSEVAEALAEADRIAPRDPEVAVCRAELEAGRGRFRTVLDSIERALELGADRGWGSYLKAEVYNRHVSPGRSIAELRETVKVAKGVWQDLAQAELLWQERKPVASDDLFKQILLEHPDHPRALLGRAVCGIHLGNLAYTREVTEALIERRGALDARVLMMRAIATARRLTPTSALDERLAVLNLYEQLRRLDAGSSPRQLGAQAALLYPDMRPWAKRLLNEARAHEPKRPRTFLLLGALELRREEPSQHQVLSHWRHARTLDPNLQLDPPFERSYREAFAEPPDLRSE